jgi:hypothetical protein
MEPHQRAMVERPPKKKDNGGAWQGFFLVLVSMTQTCSISREVTTRDKDLGFWNSFNPQQTKFVKFRLNFELKSECLDKENEIRSNSNCDHHGKKLKLHKIRQISSKF